MNTNPDRSTSERRGGFFSLRPWLWQRESLASHDLREPESFAVRSLKIGITHTWVTAVLSMVVGLLATWYVYEKSLPDPKSDGKAILEALNQIPGKTVEALHSGIPESPQVVAPPAPASRPLQVPSASAVPASVLSKEAERSSRFDALHAAAESWRARTNIRYDDFSEAIGAITPDDRHTFGDRETADWRTLSTAKRLVSWQDSKLTNENKKQVPIMFLINTGDLNDTVAENIRDQLRMAQFHIVDRVDEAALFIQISDAQNDAPWDGTWRGRASFVVTAIWAGGENTLFRQPVSGEFTAHTAPDNGDGPREVSFKRAVDQAVSNFPDWLITEK